METQLKKPSTNSVGNWTPEEDEIILRYVYDKGKGDEHMMWGNLSETLNGRSGKSCRERWFNHLDPKIKRTEWSQAEQWVLFILRNQSQEKWSLISKKLMGRTDNAVKNYWNSRLKKRIDSMQHAVNQHFQRKRKQKIAQMLQLQGIDVMNQGQEQCDQNAYQALNSDHYTLLSQEQKIELESYMERTRAEYLQKILDQVNQQNIEYFENLACEYTLQLSILSKKQPSQMSDAMFQQESQMFKKFKTINEQKQNVIKRNFFQENSKKATGNDKSQKKQGTSDQKQENQKDQEDDDMSDCQQSTYPSFMNNPEIIKMHLDILYQTVTFLSQAKIEQMIEKYKKMKEQKKKEENERLQMQIQVKKNRGRSQNQNYSQKKERKYASGGSKEYKCESQSDQYLEQEADSIIQMKLQELDGVTSRKSDNFSDNQKIVTSQKKNPASQNMKEEATNTNNNLLKDIKKDQSDQKQIQNMNSLMNSTRLLRQQKLQKEHQDKIWTEKAEAASNFNESSFVSNISIFNKFFHGENSHLSKHNNQFEQRIKKISPQNKVLVKIIKKMIKQRKQSKMIDKIFMSKKEDRLERGNTSSIILDPYIIRHQSFEKENAIMNASSLQNQNIDQMFNKNDSQMCDVSEEQNAKAKGNKLNSKIEKLKHNQKKVHFIVNNKKQDSPKIHERLRSSHLLNKEQELLKKSNQPVVGIHKKTNQKISKIQQEQLLQQVIKNKQTNLVKKNKNLEQQAQKAENQKSQMNQLGTNTHLNSKGSLQNFAGQIYENTKQNFLPQSFQQPRQFPCDNLNPQYFNTSNIENQFVNSNFPVYNGNVQNITQNIFINCTDSEYVMPGYQKRQNNIIVHQKRIPLLNSQVYVPNNLGINQQNSNDMMMQYHRQKGFQNIPMAMNANLNNCAPNLFDNFKPLIKNEGILADLHKKQEIKEDCDFIITQPQAQDDQNQYGSANSHSNKTGSYQTINDNFKKSNSLLKNAFSFSSRKGKPSQTRNNFATSNFMNQTMTQINQGKDQEINPLYKKKNIQNQQLFLKPKPFYQPIVQQHDFQFEQMQMNSHHIDDHLRNNLQQQSQKKLIGFQNPRDSGVQLLSLTTPDKYTHQSTQQSGLPNNLNEINLNQGIPKVSNFFAQTPAPPQIRKPQLLLNTTGHKQYNFQGHTELIPDNSVKTPVFCSNSGFQGLKRQTHFNVSNFVDMYNPQRPQVNDQQKTTKEQIYNNQDSCQKKNEYSNDIHLKINARDRTFSYSNIEMTPEKKGMQIENIQHPIIYYPAKNN